MPGLIMGAYAGNRLGAIRDAKGKSVAAVFTELGGAQKAEVRTRKSKPPGVARSHLLHFYILRSQILRALALKVLGAAYT